MKTVIKSMALSLLAFFFLVGDAAAQKMSAAAVVEQHYAAQTATYKLLMLGLAAVYALYMMLYVKRKREVNRFMGRSEVK